MQRRILVLSTLAAAALAACGGDDSTSPLPVAEQKNRYSQTNLVANSASYQAKFTEPDFVDAWGIAIRPAGAGGHFWVGAGGFSWQYLGDVAQSPTPGLRALSQDALKRVSLAGADSKTDESSAGKVTGVAYNGAPLMATPAASTLFRVTTQTQGTTRFDGSARFIFVTDSGVVTAWTDRATDGSTVRKDGPAAEVFNGSAKGMAFFGVAVKTDTWDRLWLADFGAEPQIRTLNAQWQEVPTAGFANPFAKGPSGKPLPGDPVPFNIQVVNNRVFVLFAISQKNPEDASAFYAAEEDALDANAEATSGNKPNRGKLVEYTQAGELVRIFEDAQRLNAPWGVAIAPLDFGKLSGALLVGNFGGAGRICAFNAATGAYIDDLRGADDKPVAIAGLWALQFGNGESLGDSNALYFAAGPEDEVNGLFGSLRYVP
jgi:uncharacterized protein (TIGR03118 family)